MKYVKNHGTELIRVLTLTKNRGKGGAIRLVNIFLKILNKTKFEIYAKKGFVKCRNTIFLYLSWLFQHTV
jgi:hypothetical protein